MVVLAGVLVAVQGGDDGRPRPLATPTLDARPAAAGLGAAAAPLRLLAGDLGPLIDRLARTDRVFLRVAVVRRDGLVLRDVTLHEVRPKVAVEGDVAEGQLAAIAPAGLSPRYDPAAGGPGIVFTASTKVLGVSVDATLRIVAQDGALVALPGGVPIGPQTLFADPRVHVDGVRARPVAGGLRVRALATLR
ncbi:MAG TPA: hypothetical protein VIM22_07415 [Solirubrobacteraceae bacterium]|jgi:hypothetical protein